MSEGGVWMSEGTHWEVVHEDHTIASKVYSGASAEVAAKKALRDFKAMGKITIRKQGTDELYSFDAEDLHLTKKANKDHSHRQE
jgi:hypothetical protein